MEILLSHDDNPIAEDSHDNILFTTQSMLSETKLSNSCVIGMTYNRVEVDGSCAIYFLGDEICRKKGCLTNIDVIYVIYNQYI